LGVWVLCGAAQIGALACLNRGCQRLYGASTAFLATVITAVHMPFWVFQVGENRPATFFVLTELAAFAVYAGQMSRPPQRSRRMVAVGVLCGLGFCLKQTVLAFAFTVVAHQLFRLWRAAPPERQAVRRHLTGFALGWCGTVGCAILALAWTGSLGWAVDAIFLFPSGRANLRGTAIPLPPVEWYADYAKPFALPLVLAAAVIAREIVRFLTTTTPSPDMAESEQIQRREWPAFIVLWLVFALGLASIGVAARPWYLSIAMPPLFVLCADGLGALLAFARRMDDTRPAFPVIVAVVWLAWMLVAPLRSQIDMVHRRYYQRFEAEPEPYAERLVAIIEANTQPNDPIFLNGYRPDIYWRTGRHCPSRYYGTLFSGAIGNENTINRRLIESLEANPPRLIRANLINRETLLGQRFVRWLDEHYRPYKDARMSNIWLRADAQ
jgi:hypothetical protein